jgi:hypothetical protein
MTAACLVIIALTVAPASAFGSWSKVDKVLRDAYGAQAARECRDYYSSLDVPADQLGSVTEAIEGLIEAGYPSGCPMEYLRLVAELTRAGIHLNDLTNKIREGVAKKVKPERLVAVITHRVEALKQARVLTIELVEDGAQFLDRQMVYTVMADYLLRGVKSEELKISIAEGSIDRFPALENLIR